MTVLRFLFAAFLSVSALSTTGCAGTSGALLTQQEITTYGQKTMPKSKPDTFKATVGALRVLGYSIAVEDADKGLIKTERKVIRAHAVGNANAAMATNVYRQYSLKLAEPESGKTEITATPRVFIGERDVSEDKVWVLDGPDGERTMWNSLFKEIESQL